MDLIDPYQMSRDRPSMKDSQNCATTVTAGKSHVTLHGFRSAKDSVHHEHRIDVRRAFFYFIVASGICNSNREFHVISNTPLSKYDESD